MTVLATLAQFRARLSGDVAIASGTWDQTIVDALAQSSDLITDEVRNARGQGEGWSFLAATAYGVQLVSLSPAGTVTAGTFTLTFGAGTTAALTALTLSAVTLQTAMNTLLGSGNSVVTGPTGGPWTITFAGTLSGPQPLLIATSSLTPSTSHVMVEELVTGSAATATRRYTGHTGGTRLLLIDDCVSVSSVTVLDWQGNLVQSLTSGTDYLPYPLNGTPITGLTRLGGLWPTDTGSVQVVLRPGYGTTIAPDVNLATLQETERSLRAAQTGEDDRLGITQYGTVVVSKALLQSTLRLIGRYSNAGGLMRRAS